VHTQRPKWSSLKKVPMLPVVHADLLRRLLDDCFTSLPLLLQYQVCHIRYMHVLWLTHIHDPCHPPPLAHVAQHSWQHHLEALSSLLPILLLHLARAQHMRSRGRNCCTAAFGHHLNFYHQLAASKQRPCFWGPCIQQM
jgi:hypothetical protein